ncbi:MAG: hypothetical protein KDA57_19450, partial [Planctomycetales bacterium]|nr:hypothetical protein [Planctomycetales bacterium]
AASLCDSHLQPFPLCRSHTAAIGPPGVGGASVACLSVFGPTLVTTHWAQPGAQADYRGVPRYEPDIAVR